jgi:6-phosphogluconate dehydrogenase
MPTTDAHASYRNITRHDAFDFHRSNRSSEIRRMPQRIAIIGLGKMGANLARQALHKNIEVVGHTLGSAPDFLVSKGLISVQNLAALAAALPSPRVVFLYVPAGPSVDRLLQDLSEVLQAGDIVADGGNSYWGDSIRRAARLGAHGIDFLDVGTSGGPGGARDGACFMVGGRKDPVAKMLPLLKTLAVEGGVVHAGPPGAGHFVKLVHNGIEFGMLQAIGEGIDLLKHYPTSLPVTEILDCWRHGTVIRSWLIDLMATAYRNEGGLDSVPPYVEDTGEVNWLVDDALHLEVATPVIAQAVMQLIASRDDQRTWARAIAMMRHGFGGHPYGADAGLQRERHEGRVGPFISPQASQ